LDKKLSILLLFTILLVPRIGIAQIKSNETNSQLKNSAFQAGEYLKYEVSYGLIKGGEAELGINVIFEGGDWYYYAKADAHTAGLAAKLFTINDVYESYFNITSGLPIKAIRNIKEEAYRYYDELLFRRADSTLFSVLSGAQKVPANTLDILSSFYYARRYLFHEQLSIGDTIQLLMFFDKKLYDVNIRLSKKEKIKTEFGKIEALKFEPIIDNKLFTDKNQMEIWFTNDMNYVPLKIQVDLPISKIYCNLKNYEGLKSTTSQLPFR
jgi:hypothetical protein